MIGIIVANVPEGLLATVTVCLTLTAQRMHAKMVLVKNLEGVETLGSTSCICSDKTGTLTQNIMTVAQVLYGESKERGCQTKDAPSSFTGGRKTYDIQNLSFQRLLRCATLCNVATFTESSKWETDDEGNQKLDGGDTGKPIPQPFMGRVTQGDGSTIEQIFWKPVGNASECAMIKLVQAEADPTTNENDVDETRKRYPKKFEIPFNSKNKYQVHVHESPDGGKHIIQMKGAPERIFTRCTKVLLGNEIVDMTDEERRNIEEQQEALSANELRCLDSEIYNNEYKYSTDSDEYYSPNFPIGDEISDLVESDGRKQDPKSTEGLVFLGIMALIDPPRPAVPPAVEKCKTAGIKVIMVTGDHPITAQAIAYKVGILWSKTRGDMEKDNAKFGRSPGDPDYENPDDAAAIVVPGHTISVDMSEERWDFILGHPQIVFARTSPQQKLVIVENNQRQGHIVAVTGDGVNDSPAIKKADIGIAMGIMGSEVSKNAADMILLDDNFASIERGVEEGRLIFDNLKKSIAYTIQSNIPEITPFLAFILFAIPLPLTTFLILAIDLGTDMIPAISMAYELPEADIMMRPPRNSKTDRLVTKRMINFSYGQIGLVQAAAGFFTYMIVLNDYGFPPPTIWFRGNSEFWGKKPFFCQYEGGNYVALNGTIGQHIDPSTQPPTNEYPFWFEGLSGYVRDCGYPMVNYKNDGSMSQEWNFQDSSTYGRGTQKRHMYTIESILANEQVGYFEYMPWRARTSVFWRDSFLNWDTGKSNSANYMGYGIEPQLYWSGRPAGLWSICAANNGNIGHSHGDSSVRGGSFPGHAPYAHPATFPNIGNAEEAICFNTDSNVQITKGEFDKAIFCNGQSSEVGSVCDNVNGGINGDGSNPFQAFYCKDSCGRKVLDINNPIYCDTRGNECGLFNDDTGCNQRCSQYCYTPAILNEDTWGANVNGYKQCMNLSSSEIMYEALKHAQGAFFISIVVGQIAGLLVCKTRWLSITTQGMRNNIMLFGIGTEFLLCGWLAYCTGLNIGLGTRNVRLVHWFCAIPFSVFIFLYDESRKALMRATSPEKTDPITGQVTRDAGWLEKNCAY